MSAFLSVWLFPQEALFSRINQDLKPWVLSGISLEMVEQVYCSYNTQSFRLQVSDPAVLNTQAGSVNKPGQRLLMHSFNIEALQLHLCLRVCPLHLGPA